tara:strand:- start:12754 stop:13560 length:807 start_codon:yes stop_codon:yes gene_type:complete
MDKGYLVMAMGEDYVLQACLLAMSIKKTQNIKNISLVTSDTVPDQYVSLFDKIIDVPWHDDKDSFYKTEHRWKAFHVTPYEETVVLDTDMLFLNDVSHWWKYFSTNDIGFLTQIRDYRNIKVEDKYYRKTFLANNIPNVYCAFHYFKKTDPALMYYKKLQLICENYKDFYKVYVPKQMPQVKSMDVNHSICVLDSCLKNYTVYSANMVHMKSKLQGWSSPSDTWLDSVPFYVDEELNLKVGNYKQHGLFHYTDNKFCQRVIGLYNETY